MADIQKVGVPGSEFDLRDPPDFIMTVDGFSFDPHDEVNLQFIPGATVVMSRDDENAREIKAELLIGGSTPTVRKANRNAIEAMLVAASRFNRSQGRFGAAAFYSEQWDGEPSADVYQVVRGRVTEKGRELFHQYIQCNLYLLLKPKL